MGEVRIQIVVMNPLTGVRSEEISALADTGATLTMVPGEVLRELGIQGIRRISLRMADGRRVEREIGEARVAVDGEFVPSRVIFGEPTHAALLGLTVLEQLGLAVDPVQRRRVPTDLLLY